MTARYTTADIFAERIVRNNRFSILSLDFLTLSSFNSDRAIDLFRSSGMLPDGYDIRGIKMKNTSNQDFKYFLNATKISGDDLLCNKLNIKVLDRAFREVYSGSVLDLFYKFKLSSQKTQDWIFLISLDDDDNEIKNKFCEFSIDLKTYRDDVDETGGIYAKRSMRNMITTGSW